MKFFVGSSVAATDITQCRECGATKCVSQALCASCLLRQGLETQGQASAEAFGKVLEEAEPPEAQHWLGSYEILEEIGRGGMGVIYRARQRHTHRVVALKRVLAYQADSHEAQARFRREAQAVASLDHPNILPIYEVSESADGLPFFSMKYARGGSLRRAAPALRNRPRDCVRLMAKVARAVSYAHGKGVLHRDLQPGNILLDGDGEPFVCDFGLAKWLERDSDLTRTLTSFGTPGYIAPEQAESASGAIGPAADTYSLGAILFHLLTGRSPFVGANALSVIHQAAAMPAPRLRSLVSTLDRDLETILARALEREPKVRYPTASALAEDLEHWLDGRPILARPTLPTTKIWLWARRNPGFSTAAAACLALTIAVALLSRSQFVQAAPRDKSIAVLPFDDLSDDKAHPSFGTGIQDDILTSLAQIHDLKVISRTSVMAYQKPGRRNMREIGQALGVANVLEGTVRRAGDRVLVNVQLIDARNDRHLWAERYDRTVADAIGLQGELATQIATALKATLAPEEKARLDTGPTTNSEAYVLYLTALGKEATDESAAEQLYVQATAIDPNFALAYARASVLNSRIASSQEPRARKAKARAQAEEAMRLSRTLGEAHMALGLCLYWGDKKYDAALKEFEVAAAASPNNADIYTYVGGIYRRQGRWREALASFDRALSLDPRNAHIAFRAAHNELSVRDWPRAIAGFNRALKIAPDPDARTALAYLEVFRNGNPVAGRKILQNIPPGIDPDGLFTLARWDLAMLERDYAAAEKIVTDSPLEDFFDARKTYYQGRTILARGDIESAQRYFGAARPATEKRVRDDPTDPEHHAKLGLLYAYMQRKEDAIREARRAVELEPERQDAFHGPLWVANLALVYALVGEQDQSIALIERLLSTPGQVSWSDCSSSITLAELRLRWEWDSLRSNPRFQKILAGPEPETILTTVAETTPAAAEKSIAVLPFENLSDDEQNAYFAAGVQDDVLTSLAQIHELKVISRTSVMAYQNPGGRNLREIAQALGVANVLEGTVRREGNRVLVSVQLIDARNDLHLWAQRFDRTVADSIGLQGELATQIAAALKAQLAPKERASLEMKPTDDPQAYGLYLQARGREGSKNTPEEVNVTEQLYARAIALDPNFALARARRSILNSRLARKEEARTEAEAALRFSPSLGEAHTALGLSLYWGDKNYDAALKEFSIAAAISPNEPDMLGYIAGIYRRQGRWGESLATFQRAAELDPANREILLLAANSHLFVRDWPSARAGYNRVLKIFPEAVFSRIGLAYLEVFQNHNPAAGRNILRSLPTGADPGGIVAETRWDFAMLERDYAGAEKILAEDGFKNFPGDAPLAFYQGRTALARGDRQSSQRYFAAATPGVEEMVRENPDDPSKRVLLALLYAYMQRKDDALREARRAVEMEPESRNAFHGAAYSANLALVDALVGAQDEAITLIERLLSTPGPIQWPDSPMTITLADLRLRWEWDSLRSNPRFQKILAGPEPKTILAPALR